MASSPAHTDSSQCGISPLSLCVPEGVAAAKDAAVLLVQTERSFRKGANIKISLSQIFGCGLAEAGLRLLPAGPLGAGKSGPVKACVQRMLSMRLGLSLSPKRNLQGGDEVAFSLGALAPLPDNQGVLRVPSFPDATQHDQLDILDLAETSTMAGGTGSRRWQSARITVEEAEGKAGTSNMSGAKGVQGGGVTNVHIQCKTTVPIATSATILLTLSRVHAKAAKGGSQNAIAAHLPALLLLHKGPGIAEVKAPARDAEEEEPVVWPFVSGRIHGKAWWSSAQLLLKICRHRAFINSLSVLPGAPPVTPARIFSADARGVVRGWTVMADKDGVISLVSGKVCIFFFCISVLRIRMVFGHDVTLSLSLSPSLPLSLSLIHTHT